jgi:sterol 14-demethylase
MTQTAAVRTITDAAAAPTTPARRIPRVSGGWPLLGHLLELRRAPLDLMQRAHDECGEIGEMRWAKQSVVMMFGEEAHEAFFRAPDEQLDQAAAYPFMTPIFGKGVVFDGTPEQRKEALRNQALRDSFMRGHAETIAEEVEKMIAAWGESGEIDLLDFFAELTIYTSSACLLGKTFRDELTSEYVGLYQDLEFGTDALAYVNPYLPLPSFRKRDRARRRLVELIETIFERRAREGRDPEDLLQILSKLRNADGSRRYTTDQITGMFISTMFAGHHTTSGTASWMLIELLRNPRVMSAVQDELDVLYADGREVSYQALREMPELEAALKESLRLHPPLIILMRKVMHDFRFKDWVIEAGKTVAVSPAISNRMGEYFEHPQEFDTERYKHDPRADRRAFAWLPFGAGRHRCVGAAFAMVQLKAIFSVLLRQYDFEMAQPPSTYRNDHSKMVVQLMQPCRVRYQRRESGDRSVVAHRVADRRSSSRRACLKVDLDLCQGHGVCASEAHEFFEVQGKDLKVRLLRTDVPSESRLRVEQAVRHCPTGALSLEDVAEQPQEGE